MDFHGLVLCNHHRILRLHLSHNSLDAKASAVIVAAAASAARLHMHPEPCGLLNSAKQIHLSGCLFRSRGWGRSARLPLFAEVPGVPHTHLVGLLGIVSQKLDRIPGFAI